MSVNIIENLFYPLTRNIISLRDKHKGDSCYIFGEGVSLKWFDLKFFNDRIGITVGVLPYHKDFYHINYKYGIVLEPYGFYPFYSYPVGSNNYIYNKTQINYRKRIINQHVNTNYFFHVSNLPVIYRKNIQYIYKSIPDSDLSADYISNQFDCYASSFRGSISLAIYMGFKKIYLLGFDYSHSPSRGLHWYEKGKGIIKSQSIDYEKDFILVAKKYAEIVNVTLDGKSKNLDYITYKDFTGSNPIYRENTEILRDEDLKILSTWPDYNIY